MPWPHQPLDVRQLLARLLLAAIAATVGTAWWAIGRLLP